MLECVSLIDFDFFILELFTSRLHYFSIFYPFELSSNFIWRRNMAKYAMLTKFPLAKFFPRAIRIETLASSVQHLLGGVSERRILPAFFCKPFCNPQTFGFAPWIMCFKGDGVEKKTFDILGEIESKEAVTLEVSSITY